MGFLAGQVPCIPSVRSRRKTGEGGGRRVQMVTLPRLRLQRRLCKPIERVPRVTAKTGDEVAINRKTFFFFLSFIGV